jgi:hypothetical protein
VATGFVRSRGVRELALAACGLASSIATALVLAVVETRWHVAIYSYVVWWLIPLGAIGAGVVGSVGYFWGARWLGVRPSRLSRASVLFVSVATFFLIHYLEYLWGGFTVAFWSYLDLAVQSASYETKVGETVVRAWSAERLGPLGYVVAALQVVGFAVGGFVVFGWLRSTPYCDSCSMYLRRNRRCHRSTDRSQLFAEVSQRVQGYLESGDIPSAVREHARFGDLGFRDRLGNDFLSRLEVWQCPSCKLSWVRVTTQTGGKRSPEHVFAQWIRGAA